MSNSRQEVVGYEGLYQISEDGRVFSTARKGSKGGERKLHADKQGYYRVTLTKEGKMSNFLVHTLIAKAFIGERPLNNDVCHRDGDKTNNTVSNLYYGTRSENARDTVKHGRLNILQPGFNKLRPRGESFVLSKLTEKSVRYIRKMKGVKTCRSLASELDISYGNVVAIWNNRSWKEVV